MNERIKEIAKSAGFFPELNWDHTGWHAAGHDDTFEKFAELIVRECMDVVSSKCASPTAYNALVEHFGVEE